MFNMFIAGATFSLVSVEIMALGRIPKLLAFVCLANLVAALI